MGADDDGGACGGEIAEREAEIASGERVHAAGGFVEDHDLRAVQERACEDETLGLAAAEGAAHGVAAVGELDLFETFFPAGAAVGGGAAEEGFAGEVEEFPCLHVRGDGGEVGHVAEDAAGIFRGFEDVDAAEAD